MDVTIFDDDFFLDDDSKAVYKFAEQLRTIVIDKCQIQIGSFYLQGSKGISKPLQYSDETLQLLLGSHDYTFTIQDGDIELSIQLYKNNNNHFRINCFSRCNQISGQLFSLNLTTEKDANGSIFFLQRIKF